MKLSDDRYALKVTAGLLLGGLVLFGASFNDPFHFDDVLILLDANVTNAARWSHFLNPLHLRQLTFFSFYLNYLVSGDSPSLYHVVNVVIHIANAALLFCLLARFLERWVAVAAAVLFLAHPIQTEPVLYIYQRSILLACFFSLLGAIAVANKRLWLALLFFLCAFESKESAIAVPIAIALLHPYVPLRGILSERGRLWIGAVGGALIVVTLGLLLQQGEETVGLGAADEVSPIAYAWAQTRVAFTYLRLLFFPYPQSLEYEFPQGVTVAPLIGLVVIAVVAWLFSRRQQWRVPALCVFAFFILLAPTSSIVPSLDAAFEHRLYLPMLAFSVFAASLAAKLPRRTWIGAAWILILAALTVSRGGVWSSGVSLWEDATNKAPGKARAWFNLGGAYLNVDPEKARAALLRGLEIEPDSAEALYNLGVIAQKKSDWRAAAAYYERAVSTKQDHWPAWNNLGNTLFTVGEVERALECFERTLSLNPDYWPAQYNIAIVHYTSGRFEKALPRLSTVLDWRPDFNEARRLLAVSLTQIGRRVEAEAELKRLSDIAATESRHTPTMILAPARP